MRADHALSIMQWLGMSDDEIRTAVDSQKTPLFVNINGEDTVPARLEAGRIFYTVGKREYIARYQSADIHPVESEGERWYEINDTALVEARP